MNLQRIFNDPKYLWTIPCSFKGKKLIKLKGEIDKHIIMFGEFNTFFLVIDRTSRKYMRK